ncbi:MAG: hypothetical protein ACRERD_07790 [Candidatus Binatia bacterium]
MAHTSADFIQQAAHNADLAGYLRINKTDCLDWAVTCLFYAAVHYVNAYLTKSGKAIPRRHWGSDPSKPGRLNIVQQDPTLSVIYRNYRHLDDESRDARYELRRPSVTDYDGFLIQQLAQIKNYILPKVTT